MRSGRRDTPAARGTAQDLSCTVKNCQWKQKIIDAEMYGCSGVTSHNAPVTHTIHQNQSANQKEPRTAEFVLNSSSAPSDLTLFLVSQRGAHDGSTGEEVHQVWHGARQVRRLQPDVVPLRRLHVLPVPGAHRRLQPLLPAPPLARRPLPALPQVLPVDRPHGETPRPVHDRFTGLDSQLMYACACRERL